MKNYKMRKNFNRHPIRIKKVYFKKGKNIVSENCRSFLKKYNVHCVIQFLDQDFRQIKKNAKRLTHFNIQNTVHKPGRNYLIVKIHKRGYFDGKTYKQSVLSSNNFIFTKCLYSRNYIKYNDLKKNIFKHSLSNTKNIKQLKKTIKRRYKRSLSHLTDAQKLSLGVAITDLKILKRF